MNPTELTADELRKILAHVEREGSSALVDWANRRITVLGKRITLPDRIMADGQPMSFHPLMHVFKG